MKETEAVNGVPEPRYENGTFPIPQVIESIAALNEISSDPSRQELWTQHEQYKKEHEELVAVLLEIQKLRVKPHLPPRDECPFVP